MAIEGLSLCFNIATFSSLMINRAISDRIAKHIWLLALPNYQSEVLDTLSIEEGLRSQIMLNF